MTEVARCSQPVTRLLAGHPRERCCIRGSVLVPVAGRSDTQQQLLLDQPWWVEAHVLSPWTISIPATMAPLIMDPLAVTRMAGKRGWLPTGHLICLITELLLCWGHLVQMYETQHLHLLPTSGERYLYISFSNVFLTNFPIMLLPCPLTIQPNHCP